MEKKTKKILFKFIGILIIILLIVTAGFVVYEKTLNKSLSTWNNKIYYGVSIGGIDVGGKTEEEAILAVKSQLVDSLQNKGIKIDVDGSDFYYAYKDFDLDYGVEAAVDEAIKYAKNYKLEEKLKLIRTNSEIDYNIPLEIVASDDKLDEKFQYIKEKVDQDPQDAKIEIQDDKVNIIKEIEGISLNEDEFKEQVNSSLDDSIGATTEVNIEPDKVEPDMLASTLSSVKDKMGECTLEYSGFDENTAYNIELSAGKINGKLIMPGEEFSFDNAVEDDKKGYKDGSIKIGDETLNNYAEGITCVSSVLYRAAIRSNLKSVERHKSTINSYTDIGFEANAIFGSDDYKFKNTYDFPIYIQIITYDKQITCNIFGDSSALESKSYDIATEVVSQEDPKVTYKDAPDIPLGTEVVEYSGLPKSTINTYEITVQGGNIVNKELISTDTYESINSIVKKGTMVQQVNPTNPDNQGNQSDTTNQSNDQIQQVTPQPNNSK